MLNTHKPPAVSTLPELQKLHELQLHRMVCHGSAGHDLVFCRECARLEGELEILVRFLDSPTEGGIH